MNPMSSEMEQDWHGAGDGLIVLVALLAYMAAIHKLLELSRASENVSKVLWGAACLLPLGYWLSLNTSYSLGTISVIASVLFFWFVGKEILSTAIAERQNLENVRRELELEIASQVIEPTTTSTKYAAPSSFSHRGTERKGTAHTEGAPKEIVISCPECTQRLRIPAGKSLNVTCAKCRSQFLVEASGEIAPCKFRIIETVGAGSASTSEKNVPRREIDSTETLFRCTTCGLERNISRDALGFHCAGCKAFNRVEKNGSV